MRADAGSPLQNRNLASSNSVAERPPPKIPSPPSSPPLKPTPPLAKSPTPSAASLANTRNPSSSDGLRELAPSFRPPLRLDQSTRCHRSCSIVFFLSRNPWIHHKPHSPFPVPSPRRN